jgi:hypothetical protein
LSSRQLSINKQQSLDKNRRQDNEKTSFADNTYEMKSDFRVTMVKMFQMQISDFWSLTFSLGIATWLLVIIFEPGYYNMVIGYQV